MFASRTYNRAYDLAADGDPAWAHWTYEQAEWERFLDLDALRMRRSRARWLSIAVLMSLTFGVFVALFVRSAGILASLAAGCLVAAVVFSWSTGLGSIWFFRSKDEWYASLRTQTREVVVTPLIVIISGKVMPLLRSGVSLNRAWVGYADPPQNMVPVLKFQLEELGVRKVPYEVWVPVPKGKESEGRELAERFQSEIVRPGGRTSRFALK